MKTKKRSRPKLPPYFERQAAGQADLNRRLEEMAYVRSLLRRRA